MEFIKMLDNQEPLSIAFSDVVNILRRAKKTILICTIICACLGGLYGFTRAVKYDVKATFHNASNVSEGSSKFSALAALASLGGSNQKSASALMLSHKLLHTVIEELALQAKIIPESESKGLLSRLFTNAIENIVLIYRRFIPNKTSLVVSDLPKQDLTFSKFHYIGELPLAFRIEAKNTEQFKVISQNGTLLAEGDFGEPLHLPRIGDFILNTNGKHRFENYLVTVESCAAVAARLANEIHIEEGQTSASVLELTYANRDRHIAVQTLNAVMQAFLNFLKQEMHSKVAKQLDYLGERQAGVEAKLRLLLEENANSMSGCLGSNGFMTTADEVDYLSKHQGKLHERRIEVDIESQRFLSVSPAVIASPLSRYSNQYAANLSTRLRNLEEKRVILEHSIQGSKRHVLDDKLSFSELSNELMDLQVKVKEAQDLIPKIQKGLFLSAEDSDISVPQWLNSYVQKHPNLSDAPIEKEFLLSYVKSLLRLYETRIEVIRGLNTSKKSHLDTYSGIDSEAVQGLIAAMNEELTRVQKQMGALETSLQQMQEEDFNVAVLSTVLTDASSQVLIQQIREIAFQLHDRDHHSRKEQRFLQNSLAASKVFLGHFMQNSLALAASQELLSKNKIRALQEVYLTMLEQQIGILSKEVVDYGAEHRRHLGIEGEILESEISKINHAMSSVPKKWVVEQQLHYQANLDKTSMETLTQLIESKNIATQLHVAEACILDPGLAPVVPKHSSAFIFLILGLCLGAFSSAAFFLAKGVFSGLSVSEDNLRLAGQFVAGTVSESFNYGMVESLHASDLTVLRRLLSHFDSTDKTLFIAQGNGPGLAPLYADLLSKQGEKVLWVTVLSEHSELSFWDGSSRIKEGEPYDQLSFGAEQGYIVEHILSKRFAKTLSGLSERYDRILFSLDKEPLAIECLTFATILDGVILAVSDEKIQELSEYFSYKSAFIFHD